MWNKYYTLLSDRNIGIVTKQEQLKIKNTRVAVAGLGGIGSPVCELLARTGIEYFHILDHGTFEPTNLNRQIFCYNNTNGRYKTDVTEDFLLRINPDIKIKKFRLLTEENISDFVEQIDIIVLAVDALIPIILLSRKSKEMNIPLIEGWALLYGNVRVFNGETPSLEEVYEFPTTGKSVEDIPEELQKELLTGSIYKAVQSMDGLYDDYPSEAHTRMEEEKTGPTLAPFVWLTSVLMTIEVLKIILKRGKQALAPEFITFDPLNYRLLER